MVARKPGITAHKYLDFIEHIENKSNIAETTKKTIVATSEGALRPLINEQNADIQEIAISTLEKSLKYHRPSFCLYIDSQD